MQDRPTADELLAAVEHFLDTEIVPNIPGSRGFHARVAANTIRTIRRELEMQEKHLRAEWAGLNTILVAEPAPEWLADLRAALRSRNEQLCELVRSRDLSDDLPEGIGAHIRSTVEDRLRVTDPDLLARSRKTLDQDDGDS